MFRQFVILNKEIEPKTKHYIGLPHEISGIPKSASLLPIAELILLQEEQNGYYLYRYDLEGNFVGDTYHDTIPDAKEQAEFEFNIKDEVQWINIPKEIKDEIQYVKEYYNAREQRRLQGEDY